MNELLSPQNLREKKLEQNQKHLYESKHDSCNKDISGYQQSFLIEGNNGIQKLKKGAQFQFQLQPKNPILHKNNEIEIETLSDANQISFIKQKTSKTTKNTDKNAQSILQFGIFSSKIVALKKQNENNSFQNDLHDKNLSEEKKQKLKEQKKLLNIKSSSIIQNQHKSIAVNITSIEEEKNGNNAYLHNQIFEIIQSNQKSIQQNNLFEKTYNQQVLNQQRSSKIFQQNRQKRQSVDCALSETIFNAINSKNYYIGGSIIAKNINPQLLQQSLMKKQYSSKIAKKSQLNVKSEASQFYTNKINSISSQQQLTQGFLKNKIQIEKVTLQNNQSKKFQQDQLIFDKQTLSMSLAKKNSVFQNKSSTNMFMSQTQAFQQNVVNKTRYKELLNKKYSLQFNSKNVLYNKNERKNLIQQKKSLKSSLSTTSRQPKNLNSQKIRQIDENNSLHYNLIQEKKEQEYLVENNLNLIQDFNSSICNQQKDKNYEKSSIKNLISSVIKPQIPHLQLPLQKQFSDDKIQKVFINQTNNNNYLKSSANPQGPSSSLSGQQITSKSCLTSRSNNKNITLGDLRMTSLSPENLKYPLSVQEAKKRFKHILNDFEIQEIIQFDNKIYYLGQNCQSKLKGHSIKIVPEQDSNLTKKYSFVNKQLNSNDCVLIPSERQKERLRQMNIFNYGYDNEQGDYKIIMRDHLAYRYEVLEFLGQGSFGQALKCLDHKTGEKVAVKIIKNKKKFQYQAGIELQILKYLNNYDPHDQNNVIRVYDYQIFREHLIISFELLSINLYEFIKNNNFAGVSQNLIRRFAIQILQALKYHQDHGLIHCDLKPENILLKQQNKSGIKVIDYGSSCFIGQRIYTYIQSRFYRAPEIIIGIPYTTAIDMWSFGAIVAELYTGFPLFPGENEFEQLAYIMELLGIPQNDVLELAQRRHLFYDKNNQPKQCPNSRGKIRYPGTKKLEVILKCSDINFIDFLNKCFEWHPVNRMTPLEALQHPWILDGLPEKVLKHHNKMFGHQDNKKILKEMTYSQIQGFPNDKKNLSIHEIIEEIRLEEEKKQKFQLQEDDKILNQESKLKQTSNNKKNSAQKETQILQLKNKILQKKQQNVDNFKKKESPHTNQSPNKDRKTRQQRKLTSQMKHNITTELNNTSVIENSENQSKLYKKIKYNDSIIHEADEIEIDKKNLIFNIQKFEI